jgi:nitrite reductase/ring-hydroxylating ferredoxin subunit
MPLIDALASEELAANRPRGVVLAGRAIAVVRVGDEIHAVDDACPQDGFPLAGGELHGLELRCEKHGGRFDLATGRCVRGGEDVRRYHAREEGGRVFVQVDEPLAELEQARLVASLRMALLDNDQPRIARECVRLLAADAEPLDLVRAAVRYGSERGAGGFHPSLAACADFARVAPLYQGLDQAIPLTQALCGVAQANRGRGQRPIPEQARGVLTGGAEGRRATFARLVEERDVDGAEAMLTGALYQGLALSEAQQWLFSASCAHVIDGGATLVHAVKALELCEALGTREAIHILPSLVPPLVYGIRVDQTSTLREAVAHLDHLRDGLETLLSRADPALGQAFDDRTVRTYLLEGSPMAAFEVVTGSLAAGVPPARVGLAIALAAAERALRFDDLLEWDDASEESWAEVLRPFAYAMAAMKAVERWPSAETLRSLFFAAALVQGTKALESRRWRNVRSIPASARPGEALGALGAAMRAHREAEAVALARGFVERGHDAWPLAEALARFTVEDALPTPSSVEQNVAITIAAVDAWEAAKDHPDAALPLLLAVRLLASDTRQRWGQRHVRRAILRQSGAE